MMKSPNYTMQIETSSAARAAALGATRQMIAEDSFEALTALLVTANAVPANVMADAFEALADKLIAKARGDLESGVVIYPAEAFDRARELGAQAAKLRGVS
jgi:hypothetical protein